MESAGENLHREVQVQTETRYEPQPSTSSGIKTRNYQSFESLLAVVKNETGYETEERPQDLSCNKESELEDVISHSLLNAVNMEQGQPASRPQIIVSPRKTPVVEEQASASGLSLPSLAGEDYTSQTASSTSSGSSRSPSKSVIVRAGSSAVSVTFAGGRWKR